MVSVQLPAYRPAGWRGPRAPLDLARAWTHGALVSHYIYKRARDPVSLSSTFPLREYRGPGTLGVSGTLPPTHTESVMGWLFRYVSRPVETEPVSGWVVAFWFVAAVVVCGFLDGAA